MSCFSCGFAGGPAKSLDFDPKTGAMGMLDKCPQCAARWLDADGSVRAAPEPTAVVVAPLRASQTVDVLSMARERLERLEDELRTLDAKLREAKMLRRMIVAAEDDCADLPQLHS